MAQVWASVVATAQETVVSASVLPVYLLLAFPDLQYTKNEPLVVFGPTTHEQDYVCLWKGPLSE